MKYPESVTIAFMILVAAAMIAISPWWFLALFLWDWSTGEKR